MTDDSRTSTAQRVDLTRRDFAKAAGGTALLAAASEPAVADELRDTDRTPVGAEAVETEFTPSRWLTVGPFQYQRRDVEVGWLFPTGGEDAFADGERTPGDERYPSAFAGGSSVEWHPVDLSEGQSRVPFPGVDGEIDPTGGGLTGLFGSGGLFDDFQDWYGLGGVIYGIGYAFATFEMEAPRRAVLETDATVWLNGRRYDEAPAGVVLQEGTNYLLAKTYLILGRFGSVSLQFRPPEAPVEVNDLASFRGTPQNLVVPDLRVGEDTNLPASVRVTNTTGERLAPTLEFAGDSDALVSQEVTVDPPLAPFETRRVNTRVQTGPDGGAEAAKSEAERHARSVELPEAALTHSAAANKLEGDEGGEQVSAETAGASTATFDLDVDEVTVTAAVTTGGTTHEREVPIRVRDADENRRQSTFRSRHDGSVQTFSYRLPANADGSSGPHDLLVSLHGANVPSINQAGANVPQDDTIVLAPGARGPVNYDHEDLGRLDDLEAIDVATERFDVDERRVYLSGHSMGGHGTWHVGLTHSDRFAAIAPSAGWTDHETYINTTWGRDKLHTFPRLKAVKETALQKNLAMPKTKNAADGSLPAFVLHGGQDQSVPTMQPRSYVRALANRGLSVDGQVGDRHDNPDPDDADVAYLEVPGAGHWWDKGIGPGNDGVNHPDLRSFLAGETVDPYPEEVVFFTTNLRVEHEKHWVAVLEQDTVHAPTTVEARVSGDGIEIRTENVARLALDTRVLDEQRGRRRVTVNGEDASLPGGQRVTVDLQGGVSTSRGENRRDGVKGPDQYGPLAEVHHDPYRLVYGTQGGPEATAVARNLANIRSQRLVERARAPAPVVPDTAVDRETIQEYNLVLFGRPEDNAVYRELEGGLPFVVGDGEIRVDDETYRGDLGVEFVYPNPRASDRLVQVETGTTLEGLRLTRVRNWIPTQTATADYQVFDDTVRFQRWNASRAAGFFDKHWQLSAELGVHMDVETNR